MTDRYNALIVVLDREIRDDDAEPLIEAIKMMKGVQDVTGNISDINSYVVESRVKRDIMVKIHNLMKEINQ